MRIVVLLVVVAAVTVEVGCSAQPVAATSPVSPSAPLPPAPTNYAGDWTVSAIQTVCRPASRYTCGRPPIQPTPHSLRLAQIGPRVTGMLDGRDVRGEVDTDGRLRLTGHSAIPDYGGTWDVASFDVTQTANGGLDGTWANEWWIPENFEPLGGPHHSEFKILGATRGLLPASFSGRWAGFFQTQGCTDARCAGPEKEFELRLDDSGGVLTGALTLRLNLQVPVLGTATGTSAELTSASDDAAPPSLRLMAMRLQRSATGGLTGTFTVEYPRGQVEQLELVQVSLTGAL